MRPTRLVALLLIASVCAAVAERFAPIPEEIPEYVIAKAEMPVVVDGEPSDKAWTAAAPIELILPWTDLDAEAPQSTTARMVYDDEALYILYECVDPYLHSEVTEHDGPVYKEDAVEIFVTPNADDISAYFGYEMNILGTFLDYMAFGGGVEWTENIHFEWESEGVRIETSHDGTLNDHADTDTGWVLEIAIPFDNFRHLGGQIPPQPGDEWRLNLNRTAGYQGQPSVWADPHTDRGSFHHSEYFGRAFFGRKP